MKIAINAHFLTRSLDGGISRYVFNICKHLLQNDSDNEYYFVSNKSIKNVLNIKAERNPVFKDRFGFSVIDTVFFSRFGFSKAFKSLKCDLAFVPWVSPFGTAPTVVTVHDLVPLCSISKEVDQYQQRFCVKANFALFAHHYAKKAALLIADSNDTKRAILETCKVTPEKVKVIPLGIDPGQFFVQQKEAVAVVRNKYSLHRPYFINVASSWQPRKNLGRLIQAFAIFSRQNQDIDLVIIGKKGPSFEEMQHLILKNQLQGKVHLLEFIPQEYLPALLSSAVSLVFPSLHEGFGLPVLEAMACGCPVIISNAGSLPEVGGDAAIYVDPFDVESIAFALERIVGKSSVRENLSQKALQRAKLFTWENTARQTLEAFREAVN